MTPENLASLIEHLHSHLAAALSPDFDLQARSLLVTEMLPGTAEFDFTRMQAGDGVGDGNVTYESLVRGFLTVHLAPGTGIRERVLLSARMRAALESWYSVIPEDLEPPSVYQASGVEGFLNPAPNTKSKVVHTLTASWTLTVFMPTGIQP